MISHLNAAFEAVAAVLAWVSVYRLHRDRRVSGVFVGQILFSLVWGLLCPFYYIEHGDYLSMVGACARDAATAVWLLLFWAHDGRSRLSGSWGRRRSSQ